MAARDRRRRSERKRSAVRLEVDALACSLVIVLLAALPAMFNPRGLNAFGVVKASMLQPLGLLAGLAAACAVWINRRRFPTAALPLAAVAVVAVYTMATIFGIAPSLSFFAPDTRHEGTLVLLALAALGYAASTFDAAQIEAVAAALGIGSIGPSLYAIQQYVAAPELRAGSTFGNPILLAGYLVAVTPITAALALDGRRGPNEPHRRRLLPALWWTVVAIQVAALASVRAKGAILASLIALAVSVAVLIDAPAARRRLLLFAGAAAAACAAVAAVMLVRGGAILGQTFEVRGIIWRDVAHLVAARPERLALGYGPGRLATVIGPFGTPQLARLEGDFALLDRAHNEMLDAAVDAGAAGVAALLALHVALWIQLAAIVRRRRRAGGPWWLPAGVLAAAVAHFVDLEVGPSSMTSQLLWWTSIGLAVAWARIDSAQRSAVAPARDTALLVPSAAGAASAALVFAFWQPSQVPPLAGAAIAAATAALAAGVAAVRHHRERGRTSGAVVIACGVAPIAMAALMWVAHAGPMQAAWSVALFFGVAAAGAVLAGGGAASQPIWPIAAVLTAAAWLVTISVTPARADLIARTAAAAAAEGRLADAVALEAERVELTPESDEAWSALGRAHLEAARIDRVSQQQKFDAASAALARARMLNPQNWIHARNQASAERVRAQIDPTNRAAHLEAAAIFLGEASALAPRAGRVWAEWGNVDAERGRLTDAFAKLDKAVTLDAAHDARAVSDAILRATGVDVLSDDGRMRAAADLERAGFRALAEVYMNDSPPRR
jgi:hypothetical protein